MTFPMGATARASLQLPLFLRPLDLELAFKTMSMVPILRAGQEVRLKS